MNDTKNSYLFHARVEKGCRPEEVWAACLPVIVKFSIKMGHEYHVSCGNIDFGAKANPKDIESILRSHRGDSYLISWNRPDFDHAHSFSYFANLGKLSFRFAKDVVLRRLDEFGMRIGEAISISNMIVQQATYLDALRQHHVPNRTNLHLAPCYNNGRDGYIEGVSAEMWFGDSFWQYAKCTKLDLLSQDWLYCEERASHLYVRAWPEPFSSADGEQGEIQRRLLNMLFGINGTTPPPLPPLSQNTIVQKMLWDGKEVRDLGLSEKAPHDVKKS